MFMIEAKYYLGVPPHSDIKDRQPGHMESETEVNQVNNCGLTSILTHENDNLTKQVPNIV